MMNVVVFDSWTLNKIRINFKSFKLVFKLLVLLLFSTIVCDGLEIIVIRNKGDFLEKNSTNSSDLDNEAKITLGLLNMVQGNSAMSQRSMAGDLGIALGLANSYLKRCVKKGLIKVSQAPAIRYVYYLTPNGFS